MAMKIGSQGLVSDRELNEEIAKVAFELYQQRGMAHGNDFEDWLKAETIVRQRHARLKEKEIDVMSAVAGAVAEKARTTRARKQPRQSRQTS